MSVIEETRRSLPLDECNIMLVDDYDSLRQVLEMVLQDAGARVHSFPDGNAAFGAYVANSGQYDLILCDWKMPGMDGFQLAAGIHASDHHTGKRQRTPIILMTALNEHLPPGYGYPAIGKPFDIDTIVRTVHETFYEEAPTGQPSAALLKAR